MKNNFLAGVKNIPDLNFARSGTKTLPPVQHEGFETAMTNNFTNGFLNMMNVVKRNRQVKSNRQEPVLEAETSAQELQVNARDYYKSILNNATIPEGNPKEETQFGGPSPTNAQSVDGRAHWFDAQSQYRANKNASDSWHRLEAFLQTRQNKDLKALDKTWGARPGS